MAYILGKTRRNRIASGKPHLGLSNEAGAFIQISLMGVDQQETLVVFNLDEAEALQAEIAELIITKKENAD